MAKKQYDRIDFVKFFTAIAVVVIHTRPFDMFGDRAAFVVHVGISRYAVPLFFAISAFLLFSKLEGMPAIEMKKVFWRQQSRMLMIYIGASLLYLPFDVAELIGKYHTFSAVAGHYLLNFIWYGSHYHLWFFPALMIGEIIAFQFYKRNRLKALLVFAVILYLIGSLGDLYDGLTKAFPMVRSVYLFYFTYVDTIRNALFFALVYISIGIVQVRYGSRISLRAAYWGICLSLILFMAEIIAAWYLIIARDFNLYGSLLPLIWFMLAAATLSPQTRFSRYAKKARMYSTGIYIVHDLFLILWNSFFKNGNSLLRFGFVLSLSVFVVFIYHQWKMILHRKRTNKLA